MKSSKIINKDNCVFCLVNIEDRIISENDLAFAIYDLYPVTEKHVLIIPKRHVKDYFDMTRDEQIASLELIDSLRKMLLLDDPSITGFNVGVNCGPDAGQSVMHAHIHLIPRRSGDTSSPRGGVRGVIPAKMAY